MYAYIYVYPDSPSQGSEALSCVVILTTPVSGFLFGISEVLSWESSQTLGPQELEELLDQLVLYKDRPNVRMVSLSFLHSLPLILL